jgi:very-short-patch-repair endonuclease
MAPNKIIHYNPNLKSIARKLRLNSTKAEIILWKYIKCKALDYQFHRQVPIDEYIVDFYCHELKLVLEIDGYTHDYNFDHDAMRQNKLEHLGINVLRFSDEDIKKHLDDVLRAIKIKISEIEAKKRHPPSPLQRGRDLCNFPP